MNANMAKVQSLIENAFTSAVEKLAKDESGNFISDLYVQADAESGELQIYDDEEHYVFISAHNSLRSAVRHARFC